MHAITLWLELDRSFTADDYAAAGLVPSGPPLGKGFFPVCAGTWDGPRNAPHDPLLFRGQDFGLAPKQPEVGETTSVPTWRHLQALMSDVGINARSCFFTNAVMGVRSGSTNVGLSPGFRSEVFLSNCRAFLLTQLKIINPHGVVVMGLPALRVLPGVAGSNVPAADTFREWDDRVPGLLDVTLGDWTGPLAVVVHPCHRPRNAKLRAKDCTYCSGHAYEVALLRQLIKAR